MQGVLLVFYLFSFSLSPAVCLHICTYINCFVYDHVLLLILQIYCLFISIPTPCDDYVNE